MPIELASPFTIALGGFRMRAPVGLLIVGMLGPPLLPAVDDNLGVHRVGRDLLPVVIGERSLVFTGYVFSSEPEPELQYADDADH